MFQKWFFLRFLYISFHRIWILIYMRFIMRIACLQDSREDTAWKLRYLSSCRDPKIHHQKDNKKKIVLWCERILLTKFYLLKIQQPVTSTNMQNNDSRSNSCLNEFTLGNLRSTSNIGHSCGSCGSWHIKRLLRWRVMYALDDESFRKPSDKATFPKIWGTNQRSNR